jgi:hypothetical protein
MSKLRVPHVGVRLYVTIWTDGFISTMRIES